MGSRISEAVNSYNARVASLLEQWGEHAAKFARKVDEGELDAPGMAGELVSCATLATRTAVELLEEAMQAGTAFGGTRAGGETVTSQPFHAPAGAALKLAGPLQKGAGLGELKADSIRIEPPQLGADETQFVLDVDAHECRGATYVGTVVATTADQTVPIVVWITIP